MQAAPDRQPLFLSFLGSLRKKDAKVYAFIVLFLSLQLVLTLAKFKVTPFYLYGMFSEIQPASDSFRLKTILVDGRPLSSYQLPFRERLMLNVLTDHYLNIRHNDNTDVLKTRIEKNYPWFTTLPFYPFFARRVYTGPSDLTNFETWFRQKLTVTPDGQPAIIIRQSTYYFNPSLSQLVLIHHADLAAF